MKKRLLSLVLIFAMAVSLVPEVGEAKSANGKNPTAGLSLLEDGEKGDDGKAVEGATEAAEKFAEAAVTLCAHLEEVDGIKAAFVFGGGLTSAVAGGIAILKILGIVEDPTEKKLKDIMTEIHNMEEFLQNIDAKLNEIESRIIKLQVRQEEIDRSQKSLQFLQAWNAFKAAYILPLTEDLSKYQADIDDGLSAWWTAETHDAVQMLYTKSDDKLTQVYTNDTSNTVPEKADNGQSVEADESFVVPASVIPATKDIKFGNKDFDTDLYADKFAEVAKDALIAAANAHTLIASDAFYTAWDALSDNDKSAKAEQYAKDLLGAITYNVSCKVMSSEHDFVGKVVTHYTNFADEVVSGSNGLSTLINSLKNMYAFEGEIKDDLEKLCDMTILSAGVYGQLALNCACQDEKYRKEDKQTIQKLCIDTINGLDDIHQKALTNNDNFCYITGSCVSYDTASANSECRFWWIHTDDPFGTRDAYVDYFHTDWSLKDGNGKDISASDLSLVSDIPASVIYDNYLIQNAASDQKMTFAQYMNTFGVGIPNDFTGNLTTSYMGKKNFSLSEGYNLKSSLIIGDYFKNDQNYNIYDGNEKASGDNFVYHDYVEYNYMNVGDGVVQPNKALCSRAAYVEAHGYWRHDEMSFFYGDCNCDKHADEQQWKHDGQYTTQWKYKRRYFLSAPFSYLKSSAPNPKPSNDADELFSVHMVKSEIKSVKLEKTTLLYTGKAQKPVVRTINGASVVEGKDYKIKVNKTAKKIGSYKATVTGIG
nr:hypothetical protein [Eubacterium sp.]